MKLTDNLSRAGRQTKEDFRKLIAREREIFKDSGYYEKKDLEFQEAMTFLEIPAQYLTRLFNRSYWNIEKIEKSPHRPQLY